MSSILTAANPRAANCARAAARILARLAACASALVSLATPEMMTSSDRHPRLRDLVLGAERQRQVVRHRRRELRNRQAGGHVPVRHDLAGHVDHTEAVAQR